MFKLITLIGLVLLEAFSTIKSGCSKGCVQKFNVAIDRLDAASGDACAQFRLGRAYDNGNGVGQDKETAIRWYLQAAEQGYAKAQYNLGVSYCSGDVTFSNTSGTNFAPTRRSMAWSTRNDHVTGGLRTSIISPTRMMREGLRATPFIVTCPFLQAAAATVRVLKMREAQSHLSMRASLLSTAAKRKCYSISPLSTCSMRYSHSGGERRGEDVPWGMDLTSGRKRSPG